eukprot:TRINITY_DN1637_c0_g2_i1.p1 TRINITY_DN1637_c0_g2~~TRINITY_DN1637_c0_g2_i1.p1  ORF type:complete len:416 (+),score=129.06 TRINITY_DN1637_c0_g2_i1:109-1248(+)
MVEDGSAGPNRPFSPACWSNAASRDRTPPRTPQPRRTPPHTPQRSPPRTPQPRSPSVSRLTASTALTQLERRPTELCPEGGLRRMVDAAAHERCPPSAEAPSSPASPALEVGSTVSSDCCCVCLEELSTRATSTFNPCGHRLHRECVDMYFRRCSVKQCPICRRTIEAMEDSSGAVVRAADLRKRYKKNCFQIRFRQEPMLPRQDSSPYGDGEDSWMSHFTFSEQIRGAAVECERTDDGAFLHRVRIPRVIIELCDSNGELQAPGHDAVVIGIDHSSVQGEVTPDTTMVVDGIAVFDSIEFTCKAGTSHDVPTLLALKFTALAPGLAVHRKPLYAGLYLPHYDRECHCCSRMTKVLAAVILLVGMIAFTALAMSHVIQF